MSVDMKTAQLVAANEQDELRYNYYKKHPYYWGERHKQHLLFFRKKIRHRNTEINKQIHKDIYEKNGNG